MTLKVRSVNAFHEKSIRAEIISKLKALAKKESRESFESRIEIHCLNIANEMKLIFIKTVDQELIFTEPELYQWD